MAATDQLYRNQKTLDIVFAVSSVLMLLSIIWMFADDYNREYKTEQRRFRDVMVALAQRTALEQVPSKKDFAQARKAVEQARKEMETKRSEIEKLRQQAADLEPKRVKADTTYQNLKADLDSRRSFYDIATEKYGADSEQAKQYKHEVEVLQEQVEEALSKAQDLANQIKSYSAQADRYEQPLLKAQGELNKLTQKFDAQVKLAIQKKWGPGDTFRNLPIIDAFAAPVKIQQFTLAELPIDYNFKYVTRFDRCMTCHQGIDKNGYTKDRLRALADTTDAQEKRLEDARDLLAERREALAGLPELKDAPTPDELGLNTVELSEGQITEFCVHPRLDLFVGSDSKHPAEKFGCTICHAGQGSATSFTLASHTPNNPEEEARWKKEHGWYANHFWDFPMLPMRFIESSCLQCHYQVTDLISSDNRIEAPKLLRGYNLLREFGCFGCHEIGGRKNGRQVGPDIRLENNPPIETLSPAERLKLLADPDNAPGDMRKVGPSLYRVSEKTNLEWVVKWLRAPRQFRPDTKMPHFYGLSNNNPHKLSDELDGPSQLDESQRQFPDAEIRSIAYYLFHASEDYLNGKAHDNDINQVKELTRFVKIGLSPDQQQQLDDALQRLTTKSPAADYLGGKARADRELVEELTKSAKAAGLNSDQQKVLFEALERLTQRPPAPLAEVTYKGEPARGRQLFSERGCLACHHHHATDKEGDGLPAIPSEAQFAPDLSQVVAKLGEGKGKNDPKALKWLVNWIKDPHVHSPRSRMPVTHLTDAEAADVAAWLLSQPATDLGRDWAQLKVSEPDLKTLKQLAEVYLKRTLAPYEVEKFFKGTLIERDKNGKVRRDKAGVPILGRLGDVGLDERELGLKIAEAGGKATKADLEWYLGKKAVGRLGCFGCHDIPGFDHAKPIGVNLQDWGRKDPSRLAFEDSDHFVEENFYLIDALTNDKGKPYGPKVEDGKRKLPYERFFGEALFHRQREGYLNLKIRDPRSYDYNRIRAWDDLSRMPQFKFARSRKRKGESDAAFEARQMMEEDQAREAVMTFILGLVAEPIPLPYVNAPSGDRLAEVKGRQVLEKFNCAGCHLIRPGVFKFKLTPRSLETLELSHSLGLRGFDKSDFTFPEHYRWTGPTPAANQDFLVAHGVEPTLMDDPIHRGKKLLTIVLTEALRYRNPKGDLIDLRASNSLAMPPEDMIYPPVETAKSPQRLAAFEKGQGPYGGVFGNLLAAYLAELNPKDYPGANANNTRASVPPVLLSEGERTQPDWLVQFLLNPQPIRKMTVLRMPRFNMSEEEAQQLVAYFAAVERLNNPGTELTFPLALVPQKEGLDQAFWRSRTREYVDRLKAAKVKGPSGREVVLYEERLKELRPVWEQIQKDSAARLGEVAKNAKAAQERLDAAEAALKKAEAALKDAKDGADKEVLTRAKETAEKARDAARLVQDSWKAELERMQQQVKDTTVAKQQKRWEEEEAYVTDAFRLLTDRNLCSKCHQIGTLTPAEGKQQGPPLTLAGQRLRPEWVKRWVAHPQRFVPYVSVMPQYFPADEPARYQELLPGGPLDRIAAVRDVLMILPRAQEMPLNRQWLLPAVAAQSSSGDNSSKGPAKKGANNKKGASQ
jgi:mono/diheme cytochrome c family protein